MNQKSGHIRIFESMMISYIQMLPYPQQVAPHVGCLSRGHTKGIVSHPGIKKGEF